MNTRLKTAAWTVVLTTIAFVPMRARAEQTLSYRDLIARLSDLSQPAVLPAEGEMCQQWSSWDRASRYDETTGKYVNWDANNDGPMFIREEGDQVVMAEMEGPGCIWRIWSAMADKGHVKIYLDGAKTPVVDLPFAKYFSGDTAPFNYPLLSYNLNLMGCSGQNLYYPIPYQKSCKIVAEKGWGAYYQFVYTTYPAGTKVPTFSQKLATDHASQLAALDTEFAERMATGARPLAAGEQVAKSSLSVPGNGTVLASELTGAQAITAIRVKIDLQDRADEMAALRELCLQITFDAQDCPSVWCPLGDFFGTAPGKNLYRTYITGMSDEGFYAYWYMPFASKAKVELVNDGQTARQVELEVVHKPLERKFDGLGHFHCKWHRDTVTLSEDRWPDWLLLQTQGHGRFMGVMLHVWNPRGGWWGEGDEKFFVDGEKFPSTFGTGSEDYFGYAWCNPGLFQRPFHAQSMTMQNQGHQSVLRWHLADNIPFEREFEASIEKYYRTEEMGTLYAATVCWYLAPGGIDPYGPVPVDERHDYYVTPPIVAGGFAVIGTPPGNIQTQGLTGFQGEWTNNDHLWWTGAKPGDKLEIVLPVEKAGKYSVSVALTKACDYGIVQLYLDGEKAGEPIDLYNPSVTPSGPIALGRFDLSEGEHQLSVEIVGCNPQAVKSYMFGLDQVILDAGK